MSTATVPSLESSAARALAAGLAGSAAFGLAAGLGHGPLAMLRGAWIAPLLFAGGAALSTPPLYLASTCAGSRASAESVVSDVASVLGDAGVVLLGLAAPAAFFSATLRTSNGWALLMAAVVAVGATAVRAVARRAFSDDAPRAGAASLLWTGFAFALGLRLIVALSHHLPVSR